MYHKVIGQVYWLSKNWMTLLIWLLLSLQSHSKVETPMITSPDICTYMPVFTFKQMYMALQKLEWQHIAERFHTCMHEHTYHMQFTQSAKNVWLKDVHAFLEPFVCTKGCYNSAPESIFRSQCHFDLILGMRAAFWEVSDWRQQLC